MAAWKQTCGGGVQRMLTVREKEDMGVWFLSDVLFTKQLYPQIKDSTLIHFDVAQNLLWRCFSSQKFCGCEIMSEGGRFTVPQSAALPHEQVHRMLVLIRVAKAQQEPRTLT